MGEVDDLGEVAAADAVVGNVHGDAEGLGPLGFVVVAESGDVMIAGGADGVEAVICLDIGQTVGQNARVRSAVPFQLPVKCGRIIDVATVIDLAIGPFDAEGGNAGHDLGRGAEVAVDERLVGSGHFGIVDRGEGRNRYVQAEASGPPRGAVFVLRLVMICCMTWAAVWATTA